MEAVLRNGIRTIDLVRQAFFAGRTRYEVPEWPDPETGAPLVVYYTPLTGTDIQQLNARETTTDVEYVTAIVILKSFKEDGQPHFQWGDFHALLSSAAYPVVFRLAQAIQTRFNLVAPTLDEAKNDSAPIMP